MTRERAIVIGTILAAQTFANIGPLGIPAIASLIRSDLGLTLTQAGSFLSAYYVGPVLMSLPAGTMADQWGIARTLILGQVVIALGLLAVSASTSYTVIVVLLALAGFGYGMLNPTSTKAVMAWSPPRHRATLVGLKQVGLPFGGALGAALLPALGLALGWRAAVAIAAGMLLLTSAVCLMVYRDPPDLARPAARTAGRALRSVLVTRDLWLVAIATLVFAAMQTVWMSFLVLYLQSVVGLSLLGAGRYLALAQAGGMAGRVAFGVLSDRVFGGRRRVPLAIAGCSSALCTLGIAFTGAGQLRGVAVRAVAGLRLRRHRVERRAAHADGRARRTDVGRHRGGPRPGGLLRGRHARPADLRRLCGGRRRLPRPLARSRALDARRPRPAGIRSRAPPSPVRIARPRRSGLRPRAS